jgi:hypothetical protein
MLLFSLLDICFNLWYIPFCFAKTRKGTKENPPVQVKSKIFNKNGVL